MDVISWLLFVASQFFMRKISRGEREDLGAIDFVWDENTRNREGVIKKS